MSIDTRRPVGVADSPRVAERGTGAALECMVFASVGTDHHPFERLVEWMDDWLVGREVGGDAQAVRCRVTVQHGTSRPPSVAGGSPLMAHHDLQASMAAASAIVTHGGPATIRDARAAGLRPLVVPRDPAFAEHVDDHQIRFTRMLADRGEVVLCREKPELFAALDRAIVDNSWLRLEGVARSEETAEAIERVGAILDEVIAARRRGDVLPRLWRRGVTVAGP